MNSQEAENKLKNEIKRSIVSILFFIWTCIALLLMTPQNVLSVLTMTFCLSIFNVMYVWKNLKKVVKIVWIITISLHVPFVIAFLQQTLL